MGTVKESYREFAERLAKGGRRFADNHEAMRSLGSGIGRTAYSHKNWPFFVFKVEYHAEPKSNISEWHFWLNATDEQREFLAKPFYISSDGRVLVMERVKKYGYDKTLDEERFCDEDAFYEMEKFVGERMWDADLDHNIGASGNGPKLYDYADRDATFWFEGCHPEENTQSYYSWCQCPDCIERKAMPRLY